MTEEEILQAIRELCSGLALSERARAARYDKIVEVLKEEQYEQSSVDGHT